VEEIPSQCPHCFKQFATKSNAIRHAKDCNVHVVAINNVIIQKTMETLMTKLNNLEKQVNSQQRIIRSLISENICIKYDDEYDINLGSMISHRSQWVYFIKEGDNNRVKIGYATTLKSRISSLQTGNSDTLEIIAFIQTKDMVVLETLFHDKLKKYRGIGEWFDLSEEQIIELLCNYRDTDTIDIKLIE
jgi:hypothetical protein